MAIRIFTMENRREWDETVRSFSDFDVYYLSGYLRGLQLHGDGEPLLFYYEAEDGSCRGMNAVMKRSIGEAAEFRELEAAAALYDLSTPYGYGGWLLEGDMPEGFEEEYRGFCRREKIVSEFVRFNPMTDNAAPCRGLYNISDLGRTVYIDLRNEEDAWAGFSSKNRNHIRKAAKEGIRAGSTREPDIIDGFMEIYEDTMDRDGAADYYYFQRSYYESLLKDIGEGCRFFYAEKDDKIIAAAIILMAGRRMHYHLSASLKEYRKLAPTNLLLWEASRFGIEKGFQSFHLGGGVGSADDSLFKFKKAFNRNDDKQFSVGRAVFDEEKYDMLVKARGEIGNPGFFPEYRG